MQKLRWGLWLVLLSGCAALAHELLWTRRLIDLLGGSHDSIARVFGCFFLGLSLGAAVSTRFARQPHRCWLIAGCIELGIAAASLPALTLPTWSQWIWPQLGPEILMGWSGKLVKLLLSVLVVVPPASLMGMSLPVIAAATLGNDRTLSRQGIWLYAVNTLGGVIGLTLTAGFGLELLGVSGAMSWALALNLIVALMCFHMHHQDHPSVAKDPEIPKPVSQRQVIRQQQHASATDQGGMAARLVISFISGCGILAAEILTLQLASNVVPDCLYTTTAVLAAVIFTLAVTRLARALDCDTPPTGSAIHSCRVGPGRPADLADTFRLLQSDKRFCPIACRGWRPWLSGKTGGVRAPDTWTGAAGVRPRTTARVRLAWHRGKRPLWSSLGLAAGIERRRWTCRCRGRKPHLDADARHASRTGRRRAVVCRSCVSLWLVASSPINRSAGLDRICRNRRPGGGWVRDGGPAADHEYGPGIQGGGDAAAARRALWPWSISSVLRSP